MLLWPQRDYLISTERCVQEVGVGRLFGRCCRALSIFLMYAIFFFFLFGLIIPSCIKLFVPLVKHKVLLMGGTDLWRGIYVRAIRLIL